MEIPKTNMVIKASSCHTMTLWIDSHTRYSFDVTFQSSIAIHRYAQIEIISIGHSSLIRLSPFNLLLLFLFLFLFLDKCNPGWSDHNNYKRMLITVLGAKKKKEITCDSYRELLNNIEKEFQFIPNTVKLVNPRIKDQEGFRREFQKIGAKLEVQVVGMTDIKISKIDVEKIKIEEEQLLRNTHEKIEQKAAKEKISIRGIQYFNKEKNKPENIGMEHIIAPLYLFSLVTPFKQFCQCYNPIEDNADGMLIEELGIILMQIQGTKVVSPIDWICTWLIVTHEQLYFPFPEQTPSYFLKQLLNIIREVYEKDQQLERVSMRRVNELFQIKMLTKREYIRNDLKEGSKLERIVRDYLSASQIQNVCKHGFEMVYRQEIIVVESLPQYLFVEGSPLEKILLLRDLHDLCSESLKKRTREGRNIRRKCQESYGFAGILGLMTRLKMERKNAYPTAQFVLIGFILDDYSACIYEQQQNWICVSGAEVRRINFTEVQKVCEKGGSVLMLYQKVYEGDLY